MSAPATSGPPALAGEDLQKLVALIKDVDSIELKVTVPEAVQLTTLRALGLDALQAQLRQAQTKLAQMQAGGRDEDVRSAQASLSSAKAKLDDLKAGDEVEIKYEKKGDKLIAQDLKCERK